MSHTRSYIVRVSILSQPEGRELLDALALSVYNDEFQSSPSPKAGSYLGSEDIGTAMYQFQSSPSPKAGSYSFFSFSSCSLMVSILSQPEGRELPKCFGVITLHSSVSILSQPEGRELLAARAAQEGGADVSILSQPEGRELHSARKHRNTPLKFQSSPSPKAGSYTV